MKREKPVMIKDVALPWSDGTLSARLWQTGPRVVVGVPELGLHCYGSSQSEAVFRLFSALVKYYRQLKAHPQRLGQRGIEHLRLLSAWAQVVEQKMIDRQAVGSHSSQT